LGEKNGFWILLPKLSVYLISEFGLMPELGQAIEEMDWMLPTDVQAEAIPLILGGGDVLMAAETGSGNSIWCCLPFILFVGLFFSFLKAKLVLFVYQSCKSSVRLFEI
jgi:hypothetical protein